MCGIAGAINLTEKFDPNIIRGLIWANRERGTDSLGLFDSSGRIIKQAGDPASIMRQDGFYRWINNSAKYAWAIGAHTRHATQGSVCKANAHPFKYRHIVGSHNGMVHAPASYIVDSELLFDTIASKGYKGLEDCEGYWGLSWFDRKTDRFYLTVHAGSLAYAVYNGVCYYSSDRLHLECFCPDVLPMSEGQVLCFDSKGNVLDSEQNQIDGLTVKADYWQGYGNMGCSAKWSSSKATKSEVVRTYDDPDVYSNKDEESEWREGWSSYFHSMSDEQFESWEEYDLTA